MVMKDQRENEALGYRKLMRIIVDHLMVTWWLSRHTHKSRMGQRAFHPYCRVGVQVVGWCRLTERR